MSVAITIAVIASAVAGIFPPQSQAQTDYSLVSVSFPGPVLIANTTLFTASFVGSNPTFPVLFVLHVDWLGPVTGTGWPVASFTVTVPGGVEEGRYGYHFSIGDSWKSENRTVDVVDYYHLQFENLFGTVENKLNSTSYQVATRSEAEQEWRLAQQSAFQQDWKQGYLHLREADRLLEQGLEQARNNYWNGITLGLTGFGLFSAFILGAGLWKIRQIKRLSRANRRKMARK